MSGDALKESAQTARARDYPLEPLRPARVVGRPQGLWVFVCFFAAALRARWWPEVEHQLSAAP